MTGRIDFHRDPHHDGIGVLTLAHPGKLNAISVEMWHRLRELASSLDTMSPSLGAVIVRGEGGNFAAGADIEEFPTFRFDAGRLRHYHEQVIAPALHALLATDVPLVAQIEGVCVGGGLEIACCCDLRVAAPTARFGAPIARLGFPMAPDELAVVVRAAGRVSAAELLLEACLLDAPTALQRGLLHRIAPDAPAEARATAGRIAALPHSVARANKRTLRQLDQGGPTPAQRDAHFLYADSQTHRNGILAFLARTSSDTTPQ